MGECNDGAVKKALQSFEHITKWKRALLEDRDLSQTFEAGIHNPLLYAQSRFFVGSKIQTPRTNNFEENKTFAIDLLQPGHGLYDALQACRHDVVPQELCATLIADVILVLEFQATLRIIQPRCIAIFEIYSRQQSAMNSARVDSKIVEKNENDLHYELLQLENCEDLVMESLGRAGLSTKMLHLTPYMRQKIYSMTELMPSLPRNIFRNDDYNKVRMQRIARNWAE
ncbi:hypothetical protein FIBSPDRAFT_123073 [Athelia psychrophila]|uniref:Uncharacterized protein n=1 Tax=Athelia psychrophila TaxID=1759441 RepID=A0A166CMI9_9AGAM|nr:hypothetical protein FIBSPDRAFT_123073 [Fibularhizoctonia sp. CBS 109695]